MHVAESAITESENIADPAAIIVLRRFAESLAWRNSAQVMGASVSTWLHRMDLAYNKVYEPQELASYPNRRAYFGLINFKVNTTHAWFRNLLLNQRWHPFTITPTPVPDLPDFLDDQAFSRFRLRFLNHLSKSGLQPDDLLGPDGNIYPALQPAIKQWMAQEADQARQLQYQMASRATEAHTRVIQDQMIEGEWHAANKKVLFDICLNPYGTLAVEMGRVLSRTFNGSRHVNQWKPHGYTFRHVRAKDSFHAPDADSARNGSFFIERLYRTPQAIAGLKGSKYAIADGIDQVLLALQQESADGGDLDIAADAEFSPHLQPDGTLMCLRMSGNLYGSDIRGIRNAPMVNDDDLLSVVIEVAGNRAIYFEAKPFGNEQRGYFSASYSGGVNGAAGISIGMMLYDRQMRMNRLDFFAALSEIMAHGPVIERRSQGMQDASGFTYRPWREYESAVDAKERALHFHQAQPMWTPLTAQFIQHLQFADHESGIPAFAAYGVRAGSNPTLGQDVIQYNAASKGVQAAVENYDDDIISPSVTFMYDGNMARLDDPSIKADARIHARGALGAMNKESQMAQTAQTLPILERAAQTPGTDGAPMLDPAILATAYRQVARQQGLPVGEYHPDEFDSTITTNGQPGIAAPGADGRSRLPA